MKEQDSLCPKSLDRRGFLTTAATALTASTVIAARDWTGKKPTRYPEPDVLVLDPAFAKYKLGNTPIRRLYTNPDMLWAEGPAWNGVGKYLLWSDIPNNVQLRWLEEDGHVSKFRHPSGNSNGNTFDWIGRQISCEHGNRRVVRYEYNGKITVLADKFGGKQFNAPNDAVVHPEDGAIWFTDPGYGSLMNYEGNRADTGSVQPIQKEAVYRIDLLFIPYRSLATAMAYYTGPYELNSIMRGIAKRMCLKLNEHYYARLDKTGHLTYIYPKSEAEVFQMVDMQYLTPRERDAYRLN